MSILGPSPRVWGKPRFLRRPAAGIRTIPTRVGKTRNLFSGGIADTDHPHACGENRGNQFYQNAPSGPSPRVWGKREATDVETLATRTIPTRVGKTAG